MKKKRIYISLILLLIPSILFAQNYIKTETGEIIPYVEMKFDDCYLIPTKIIDGDTVLHVYLHEIIILPPFKFKNQRHRDRYSRLVRYVKKVYPYAVIIRNVYKDINSNLDSLDSKQEKKQYVKEKEKELRKEFEGQLRKLTFTQGRILIKLVDRETGDTTYDVVKQLRGGMSAFFWQSIARLFGSNLKSEYNADGDDKMIEDIIVRIENGQL